MDEHFKAQVHLALVVSRNYLGRYGSIRGRYLTLPDGPCCAVGALIKSHGGWYEDCGPDRGVYLASRPALREAYRLLHEHLPAGAFPSPIAENRFPDPDCLLEWWWESSRASEADLLAVYDRAIAATAPDPMTDVELDVAATEAVGGRTDG